MGVDGWTRTPFERKHKAREAAAKKPSDSRSISDKAKDWLAGEHKRCACGCGQPGTYFRDRKLYNSKCVGRGSGWSKAGLPEDRTPPMARARKRELNRNSRRWDSEGS